MMIRNQVFYRPIAKLFNRFSDVLFHYIENNDLSLKKWDETITPELQHCSRRGTRSPNQLMNYSIKK